MNKSNFTLSANLENGLTDNSNYIVTPNVEKVLQEIVNGFQSGIHSFTIIGTYGTGKSSFLLNLEDNLVSGHSERILLPNPEVIYRGEFEILNIIGDFKSLQELVTDKLREKGQPGDNPLEMLKAYYSKLKKQGKLLFIAIDEFGKVLEHAALRNPEEELYFFQKFTEIINTPSRNILLLTTLHQNFSAYANRLTQSQKNEWEKVKGRFKEVVFAEPVEQLLFLAAQHISSVRKPYGAMNNLHSIHKMAETRKFITKGFDFNTAKKLYPLDTFAAYALTRAIQRYGQNERSLFTFLNSKGKNSILEFEPNENLTYNLAEAYDYIVNNFYSYLNDANTDSMAWSSIRLSIERVEGSEWKSSQQLLGAVKIVKAIGMINLFGNGGFTMTTTDMASYAATAMNIDDSTTILNELQRLKIIRFAEYKQRLILFEGTDINIEEELTKAALTLPPPINFVDDLRVYFNNRVSPVKASYYHRGTPRYFEYTLLSEPTITIPTGDVDGYIEMIFSASNHKMKELLAFSENCEYAIIFVYFNNTDEIVDHIYKIQLYRHIIEKVLIDKSDRVALKEIGQLIEYEKTLLNKDLNESLFSYNKNVTWIYKGQLQKVESQRDFNKLLSVVCDDIYYLTPVVNNELFNKHKLSSNISSAKAKYLQALLEHSDQHDLGFEESKYPPEKTIYYSLLKSTGLHCDGEFMDAPSNDKIKTLWEACENFLYSTTEKPKKVSELIKLLSTQPYKVKDGLLDFWIPTYLFIKRQDYSLYGENGQYIPNINSEFFDLLKKHPGDFKVKAYAVDGIKLQFFNQYRKFIGQGEFNNIKGDTFIETIKPFFFFYARQLNEYAKHTQKIDHKETIRFRDVLSKAKDPEKTFFEDLPEALGYNKEKGEEFVRDYCYIIQRAIRELRGCYNQLIDRIEQHLVEGLGLSTYEYPDYVNELQQRLSKVKPHLLTTRQKEFYQHAMAQFDKRVEWYQSVCYSVLGSPLDRLRDEQEPKLLDDLIYLFRECEKQAVLSEGLNYKIDENEEIKSAELEKKIESILSGDDNLDIYTIMRILQKRMNKDE
ncbi:MAG: hypothetical protein ACI38V_05200 [Bacteroides sp.]